MATLQAALMIALVVEGRTAFEQFEATEAHLTAAMHKQAEQHEAEFRKVQQDWRLNLPPARPKLSVPSLVIPKAVDPQQPERFRRVTAALLALPVFALGLAPSLVSTSPIPYVGAVPIALAGVMSTLAILIAIYALVVLSVLRVTGRTVRELLSGGKKDVTLSNIRG